MKNELNTDRRKSETASDVELALMLFVLIVVSFAAGYYAASAQIAAMMAN